MPKTSRVAIDWDSYNDDVIEFYVNQNHTIAETISYLKDQHGVQVS